MCFGLSAAILALLAASPIATGATTGTQGAWDERLRIGFSGFHAGARVLMVGEATFVDGDDATLVAGRDVVGDHVVRPHLHAEFRMAGRHRLLGGYYRVNGGSDIHFADELPVETPPRIDARLTLDGRYDIDFRLAKLMYEYALVESPRWLAGLSGGLHWARLGGTVRADARIDWNGDPREYQAEAGRALWRMAPSLGLRIVHAPTRRWRIGLEAQGFSTEWGRLSKERGHFERAALLVEYRLGEHLGLQAGYDWFRLKYTADFDIARPEQALRLTGRGRADLRMDGPTLGMTLSF